MTPPTPIEWMAFADGELDDERAEEILMWLEAHPEDAARLQRIQGLHEGIHQAAQPLAPPADFDLSSDIMAAIEREAPRESGPRRIQPTLGPSNDARPASPAVRTWAKVVFGLVAAAAAALLLAHKPQPPAPAASTEPAQTASAMIASVALDEDAVLGDDGSAINAVDFGSQSGAIFYVRGQTSTSAVLWIDDNDSP